MRIGSIRYSINKINVINERPQLIMATTRMDLVLPKGVEYYICFHHFGFPYSNILN